MGVTAIYSIRAREGRADELLEILLQGRDFSLTVEGCEGFEVLQARDDPHKFVMIERWATVEDHQSHFESNVKATGVLDSAEALMTEPFQSPYEAYHATR